MARTKQTTKRSQIYRSIARTKQTAKKKKEITGPIAITDPTELEIDTKEDEYDNMDTTEQDKDEEACLIRTRLEEKLRETVTQYIKIIDGKSKIPVRRDNMAERNEMTNTSHEYLILKMELTEDLKRSNCPKHCETHKSSEEIYEECKELHIAQITERGTTGIKMKASEKDDFRSPTKTSKQPRKEKEKFQIPITNQFEALTNQVEDTPAPTLSQEKKQDLSHKHHLTKSSHASNQSEASFSPTLTQQPIGNQVLPLPSLGHFLAHHFYDSEY
ncbi:hypothetical protein NPIL_200131 [Nephila pilipes]|uniref:Uncharacterized protein n=1 Tax=Nephila pilipes TaxID=299642 RepID=A0A8X6PD13_NEPPI|nr:hypothetical protein NPIL_287141 [Nephila pilipes]GFT58216.1 hypothetical protein NPIL_200131 [Nephila pilipes]